MVSSEHILISIESRHAENIFGGLKHIELRRRMMHVNPGTIALIYAKLPVGSIVGRVTIQAIETSSPRTLWKKYGTMCGLDRSEFFDYFTGARRAFALCLAGVTRFPHALSLEEIRCLSSEFQPPQFFARLGPQHPLLAAVAAR